MPKEPDYLDQLRADCSALGPDASDVAGVGVGALAAGLTKNPLAAVVAGKVAEHAVEQGWDSACDLAAIVAETVGPEQQAPAIDSPAPSPDTSISISD